MCTKLPLRLATHAQASKRERTACSTRCRTHARAHQDSARFVDGPATRFSLFCSAETAGCWWQPRAGHLNMTTKWRVIVLDQDNARASAGWPHQKEFRERVARCFALDPGHVNTLVVIAVDERRRGKTGNDDPPPPVRARTIGNRVVVAFSGPRMRADDLIARDIEWFGKRADVESILVVSSDKLVRRRCGEIRTRVRELQMRFETGEAFAMALKTAPPFSGPGPLSGKAQPAAGSTSAQSTSPNEPMRVDAQLTLSLIHI